MQYYLLNVLKKKLVDLNLMVSFLLILFYSHSLGGSTDCILNLNIVVFPHHMTNIQEEHHHPIYMVSQTILRGIFTRN